jgi:hypothetical protein
MQSLKTGSVAVGARRYGRWNVIDFDLDRLAWLWDRPVDEQSFPYSRLFES